MTRRPLRDLKQPDNYTREVTVCLQFLIEEHSSPQSPLFGLGSKEARKYPSDAFEQPLWVSTNYSPPLKLLSLIPTHPVTQLFNMRQWKLA